MKGCLVPALPWCTGTMPCVVPHVVPTHSIMPLKEVSPMTTIPQVAHTMREILTTIADEAACTTRFVQRTSPLGGVTFSQTLVFSFLRNRSLKGIQQSRQENPARPWRDAVYRMGMLPGDCCLVEW